MKLLTMMYAFLPVFMAVGTITAEGKLRPGSRHREMSVSAGDPNPMLELMAFSAEYARENPPPFYSSFLQEARNVFSSVFESDCNTWLLQSTFTIGFNQSEVTASDLNATYVAASIDLAEQALLMFGEQQVGGCTFETTSFDFIDLKGSDDADNTVTLDVDWGVSQQNCGCESTLHAALQLFNFDLFIFFFQDIGMQNSNVFLDAITAMSYTCPRDSECC